MFRRAEDCPPYRASGVSTQVRSQAAGSTSQWFNGVKPFWRNVILIALAHVALIAGLIRWSVSARASSNPESIVWLGGAGDLTPESEKQESPSPHQPPTSTESRRSEQDEAADEKPVVTTAK